MSQVVVSNFAVLPVDPRRSLGDWSSAPRRAGVHLPGRQGALPSSAATVARSPKLIFVLVPNNTTSAIQNSTEKNK